MPAMMASRVRLGAAFLDKVDQMLAHGATLPLGIGQIDLPLGQWVVQAVEHDPVRGGHVLRNCGAQEGNAPALSHQIIRRHHLGQVHGAFGNKPGVFAQMNAAQIAFVVLF